jgi:hypothetical protein
MLERYIKRYFLKGYLKILSLNVTQVTSREYFLGYQNTLPQLTKPGIKPRYIIYCEI